MSSHSIGAYNPEVRGNLLGWFSTCAMSAPDSTTLKILALKLASLLTEPVCLVREYYYTFYTLGYYVSHLEKITKAAFLILGIIFSATFSFLALPAIAIRGLVAAVETEFKSFVHITWDKSQEAQRSVESPVRKEEPSLTTYSANVCLMPGYSLTHGQLPPRSKRIGPIIQNIRESKADFVFLMEVPDVRDAHRIAKELKDLYPEAVFAGGTRAIGPNSMQMILFKPPKAFPNMKLGNIEFHPFDPKKNELLGEAAWSTKGYFTVDLMLGDEIYASVITTHLMHSKYPQYPTKKEKEVRSNEMDRIFAEIQKKKGVCKRVILTGDLNFEEPEFYDNYKRYCQNNHIDLGLKRDPSVEGKPTWGGDRWCCSNFWGEPDKVSGAIVLDFTVGFGSGIEDLDTTIQETGYDAEHYNAKKVLSDHCGLRTKIRFKENDVEISQEESD